MRIVIAPDSFKHSLSARAAAQSISAGILSILPGTEIISVPVADGGEGTMQSLVDATSGIIHKVQVHDPLMRKIMSSFGILGDEKTAIIEMATASGLELLEEKELDVMSASTFGTGELISSAMDMGCRRIIVAIGGSATNDGGVGMARALGIKFLDESGTETGEGGGELNRLAFIDDTNADERLKECEFLVAADVTNPLTGKNGATRVYAPQKGATAIQVDILEKNLTHFAEVLKKYHGKDIASIPGAGAAGGLGAGLMAFAGAKIHSGFGLVNEITQLESKIKNADLVITGEGKIDHQTQYGKTPFGVATLAKKYNKPLIAFAGSLGEKHEELYKKGFDVIFPIAEKPQPLEDALKNAATLLQQAAERMARMYLVSMTV
jgi:glycerate 2-kinase